MKEEEKKLIIDLLFNKFKENKDESILKLIEKVNKINFVAERVDFSYSMIGSSKNNEETLIDYDNMFFELLDLSNTNLYIKGKKIKVLTHEEFHRKLKEEDRDYGE